MNGLIAFLLRSGGGLLREGAEILIGQALIRSVTRRLTSALLFYGCIAVFAMTALIFLYALIDRYLSLRLGEINAAAILFGANLVLIALLLAGRALLRPRRVTAGSPLAELMRAQALQLGKDAKGGHFEAGLAVGAELGRQVRKAAPQIALAAAVIGLVIGLQPQLLGLFDRRRKSGADDRKSRRRDD